MSARSGTSTRRPANGGPARTRSGATTTRSRTSPIRTATRGCSRSRTASRRDELSRSGRASHAVDADRLGHALEVDVADELVREVVAVGALLGGLAHEYLAGL